MRAKNAKDNLILFSVMFLLGIIFYLFVIPAQVYVSAYAAAEAFTPVTFPRFATVVFIIASFLGIVVTAVEYRKAVQTEGKPEKVVKEKTKRERYAFFIPYIIFVLCIVYAILFKMIGVIPATLIIPTVAMICLGCKKWNYYAILIAFSGVLYVLFRFVLQVPLH